MPPPNPVVRAALALALACSSAPASADDPEPEPPAHASVGVETSALWPVFPGNLFVLRAAVPVADQHQLLAGAQGHIPHDRDDEGRFATLAGQLGYRGYLWRGLHLDGVVNAGWGRLRDSVVDRQDYDSFDVELMALAGYRIDVGPAYLVLQPLGVSAVVYKSNPWPIVGEGTPDTEGPIYVGNVLVGLQL